MSDAVILTVVGGIITITVKLVDFAIDKSKAKDEGDARFEEQRNKFIEDVLTRLEQESQDRKEAEVEVETYREKYWKMLEDRVNALEAERKRR
jgi:hypothetical protein